MPLILLLFLLYMSYKDIQTKTIPVYMPFLMLFTGVIMILFFDFPFNLLSSVLGLSIMFTIFMISAYYFKGGGADAIIAAVIGFIFGLKAALIIMMFASIYCISYIAFLQFVKKKRVKNIEVPFVPFITLGYLSLIYILPALLSI